MKFSSNFAIKRGLDTMFIVYSLLADHPASAVTEQYIRAHDGWFTTAASLLEAQAILTKVYGVSAGQVTAELGQFTQDLVVITPVDEDAALAAMQLAEQLKVDLTDALLLTAAGIHRASCLATDDHKLLIVGQQLGFTIENPIDAGLRQQLAQWELANLPPKGMPRILRQIHDWLSHNYPQAATDFWSRTGGGARLP